MTTRVLFLCTGNSARSQMAEAFLRKFGGDQFEAHSAGLEPKGMNPFTIKVMEEVGIDVSDQKSKGVDEYLGKTLFQHLVTVCDDADKNCPTTWPGISNRMHWSFEDPAAFEGTDEEKLAKFRQIRDQIDNRIRQWVAEQAYKEGGEFLRLLFSYLTNFSSGGQASCAAASMAGAEPTLPSYSLL